MNLTERGYRAAEAITRDRAKSFAFSSVALDPATRRAAFAVYAFCRRCDDAVDGDTPEFAFVPLARRVRELRLDVDAVYDGDDRGDPILAAFGDVVRERGIPRDAILGLVDGMEQDLTVKRYETWDELLHYCDLAAGTVGRMMAAVFGVLDQGALEEASALGCAMQLTNVLRDVKEDLLVHGRIYLPQEALRARGLDDGALLAFCRTGRLDASTPAQAFRGLMREASERAWVLYRRADRGIPRIVSGAGRACTRLMRSTYSEILHVLEARGWDPFLGRASTTTARKVRVAARALLVPSWAGGGMP